MWIYLYVKYEIHKICGLLGYNAMYKTTWYYNPEDHNQNFHYSENLKPIQYSSN
jgi:hypothetical protein